MELREFMDLADRLIDQLAPRLDPQQVGYIREDARGGDWDEALDLLVATLDKRRSPITPAERDTLRQLVERCGWSTERLDNLNVVPEADGGTTVDQP